MKRILILVAILGVSVSINLAPVVGGNHRNEVVFDSSIVACGPTVNCGGFPQNVATMGPVSGAVTVLADGHVRVMLKCNCANQEFEVFFGSFTNLKFAGNSLGTIMTNNQGRFNGAITTQDGAEFVFPSGPNSGQFVFNVHNLRSEFITGFNIP